MALPQDNIGNVTSMIIIGTDQSGNPVQNTVTSNSIKVSSTATYTQVDTVARALNNLTRNTYVDTNLITVISVEEILAQG